MIQKDLHFDVHPGPPAGVRTAGTGRYLRRMADFIGADLRGARFERTDLTGARLHRVDLNGAEFRSVDLTGALMWDVDLVDAEIHGEVMNLTINDVDVGSLIEAELSKRDPDRARLRPADPAGFREAWDVIERLWGETAGRARRQPPRSEEHTSELQSQSNLVCRLLLEKKNKNENPLFLIQKQNHNYRN